MIISLCLSRSLERAPILAGLTSQLKLEYHGRASHHTPPGVFVVAHRQYRQVEADHIEQRSDYRWIHPGHRVNVPVFLIHHRG